MSLLHTVPESSTEPLISDFIFDLACMHYLDDGDQIEMLMNTVQTLCALWPIEQNPQSGTVQLHEWSGDAPSAEVDITFRIRAWLWIVVSLSPQCARLSLHSRSIEDAKYEKAPWLVLRPDATAWTDANTQPEKVLTPEEFQKRLAFLKRS